MDSSRYIDILDYKDYIRLLHFHIVEVAYSLCGMGIHCQSQITSQSKRVVSATNWLGNTLYLHYSLVFTTSMSLIL